MITGIEAVNLRCYRYTMHPFEAIEIGDDLPLRGLEDNKLIGIHVRDVQPTTQWVEGLIVEPYCRIRHGISATFVSTFSICVDDCPQAKEAERRTSRQRF